MFFSASARGVFDIKLIAERLIILVLFAPKHDRLRVRPMLVRIAFLGFRHGPVSLLFGAPRCTYTAKLPKDINTGHGFVYGGKSRLRIGKGPTLWRKSICYGEHFSAITFCSGGNMHSLWRKLLVSRDIHRMHPSQTPPSCAQCFAPLRQLSMSYLCG